MIYHPDDCDVHFGPCPTDAEVDGLRALVDTLPDERPEPAVSETDAS